MLAAKENSEAPRVALSRMNFGAYETVGRTSRLESRFYHAPGSY